MESDSPLSSKCIHNCLAILKVRPDSLVTSYDKYQPFMTLSCKVQITLMWTKRALVVRMP